MRAYDTIEELYRLARLPHIDDAQLGVLVDGLASTDSYTDQEDGGYGSHYTREYVVTVSRAAECALCEAAPKVLPRLVARIPETSGAVRDALLRVVTAANISTWATLAPDDRARALAVLDRLAGELPPFATLVVTDDAVTSGEARVRDLVALVHVAIDAAEGDVERGVEPVVRALLGPSARARKVARDAAAQLQRSPTLGPRLLDAFFDRAGATDPESIAGAIKLAEVQLDAHQRARLAAVLDDVTLGYHALTLLESYLLDPIAEAELPLAPQLLPRIARECATSTNEGNWRYWIGLCGSAALAAAVVPILRSELPTLAHADQIFPNLALLGRAAAPIAPELLFYLDVATSPSSRHVHQAVRLAGAIAAPVLVPALIALLATGHQYEAIRALAAIGPEAAAAIGALESVRFVEAGRSREGVESACAEAIAAIRG